MISRFAEGRPFTRQNNPKFGELAGLGIDLYGPAMLLDDDVMADREPKPRTFTRWLGGEKRIEHLLLHVGRYAGAVVANADFDAVAEVLGRSSEDGLVIAAIGLGFALGGGIKAETNG